MRAAGLGDFSGLKIICGGVCIKSYLVAWKSYAQVSFVPNQFFTYGLTMANSSISMQNARIPGNFVISKEIKKELYDKFVKFDLLTIIYFLPR